LEEFSPQERSLFLKFVWGRTRLPPVATQLTEKFCIQSFVKKDSHGQVKDDNQDQYLPEARKFMNNNILIEFICIIIIDTCFFALDLPRYSSKHILREKLLYAIYNCRAIDTDFRVRDEDA
jgi:E3 ubiquitin-protein ligase HERC2